MRYPAVGVHERVCLRLERVPLKIDAEGSLLGRCRPTNLSRGSIHPTPYILHPTRYTLHPWS